VATGLIFLFKNSKNFTDACSHLVYSPKVKNYVESNFKQLSTGEIEVIITDKETINRFNLVFLPKWLINYAHYVENLETGIIIKNRYA